MSIKIPTHLTIVIRDDSPMIHCADVPSYRRVTFKLTDEQMKMIELKATSNIVGKDIYECISKCFLEIIADE